MRLGRNSLGEQEQRDLAESQQEAGAGGPQVQSESVSLSEVGRAPRGLGTESHPRAVLLHAPTAWTRRVWKQRGGAQGASLSDVLL